jgi:hypothetical protein
MPRFPESAFLHLQSDIGTEKGTEHATGAIAGPLHSYLTITILIHLLFNTKDLSWANIEAYHAALAPRSIVSY